MSMTISRARTLAVAAVAAAVAASGFALTAGAAPSDDLAAAKAATARYHSVAKARADGYVRSGGCVATPAGAMGVHYVNPELAGDGVLDPERPEMLVYLPRAKGGLELVALEYFQATADQEPPIESPAPSLFGRTFDGPMAGHGPGAKYHHALHVWAWEDNPAGMFAPLHPRRSCAP